MRINLLAKRYAQAVFDLALEMKVEGKVEKDMHLVGQVLQDHREFKKLLKNPVVDDYKKVRKAVLGAKLTSEELNIAREKIFY